MKSIDDSAAASGQMADGTKCCQVAAIPVDLLGAVAAAADSANGSAECAVDARPDSPVRAGGLFAPRGRPGRMPVVERPISTEDAVDARMLLEPGDHFHGYFGDIYFYGGGDATQILMPIENEEEDE